MREVLDPTAMQWPSAGQAKADNDDTVAGSGSAPQLRPCPAHTFGLDRMARWGEGYIGGSLPAPMIAPTFDAASQAWQRAGHAGSPRLVALAYYTLGEPDTGKRNVYDYYNVAGNDMAHTIAGAVCDSAATVEAAISSFADIGADELIFNPGTDDPEDVTRLAEIAL